MILVLASFRMPTTVRAEIDAPMAEVIRITRGEHGCIAYDCAEDVLEPGVFRVSELWTDRDCLAAHAAAPHMTEWTSLRQSLGMSDRKVDVYEVAAG